MVGLVKEAQCYWLTFIVTFIALGARPKGGLSEQLLQALPQGGMGNTVPPGNFTQDSSGIGKLGSAPTPTDTDSTGWGGGDLDQVEEETFKRGLPVCSRQTDSGCEHPGPRCSGKRRRHHGWSTESLGGRCPWGWDTVRSHGKEFDFI